MILQLLWYLFVLATVAVVVVLGLIVYLLKKYNHPDVEKISLNYEVKNKSMKTCVIIGGSLGGLFAAKMMSRHAEKVILLEKKHFEEGKSHVPQGGHLHGFVFRGVRIINKLFPGIVDDLEKRGFLYHPLEHWRFGFPQGVNPKTVCEPVRPFFTGSRYLLESTVREYVFKTAGIEVIQGASLEGYVFDDKKNVKGVHWVLDTEPEKKQTLMGDLVIDCSGLMTQSPKWFADVGFHIPRSDVKTDVRYATFLLNAKKDMKDIIPYSVGLHFPTPNSRKRYTTFAELEKNKWIISTCTLNNVELYNTLDDILNEMRVIYPEFVKEVENGNLERASDRRTHYTPGGRYFHYERVKIGGFIAVGDALCHFNPTYGQGMTSALLTVSAIDEAFCKHGYTDETLSVANQLVYNRLKFPWLVSTQSDLRFDQTEYNLVIKWEYIARPIMSKLLTLLFQKIPKSPRLFTDFMHIMQLDDHCFWGMLGLRYNIDLFS